MVDPLLSIALSIIGVLLLPSVALLWRVAVNSTRDRDKISQIARDMTELKTSTNQRLRWLEENVWIKGGRYGNRS